MVSAQEYANRQRYGGGRTGVSVYEPVRPTGAVANSGTAQRILQRRQPNAVFGGGRAPQFQQPRGGGSAPPGGGQRTGLDDILDSFSAQTPQQAEAPGGWKGALGTVVNSVPFKAVMAPLNILDIPRRAVISTGAEVADVFNGGDASWNDWFDQVRDPSFGFGSVIGSTGNKWADRFIGFAGDVLLDPLTYVAGAGVWSGTGRAARTRLAGLAAAEGLSEDVIRSVGRYGLSGIDNATRARLRQAATLTGDDIGEQILDRGYYLKVPFKDSFHRIPATAKLDELISPVFARGRARFAEGRLGTSLRNRLRTPEVMREATEKLITGRGTMGFEDAAGIYLYVNAQRQLGNTATQRFYGEAQRLTKSLGVLGRRTLDDMIDAAETQGGTALNALFERAAKFMQDAGINFYPRKNYVPHILSQGALEWFREAGESARRFREALIPGLDLDDISPRLMERHLTAGTVAEFGPEGAKRTFNAGAGTIKDINAEFRRVFPELKFKLFEDEAATIFARYGRHLGDDVGRAGGLKTLLNSKSRLVRLRSDEDMVKTLIDEESLDLLNKQTADMLRSDHRALTDRITRLRQDQERDTLGLQGVLGIHMRDTIDELENLEPKLKGELDALIVQEAELASRAGRTSVMTGEPATSVIPQLESKLNDAYTRLEQRAMAADQRLADLQQKAASEAAAWASMQRMAGMAAGMLTIPDKFTALRSWNITAAEAASLAMDRQAVSTMREELAALIRKADLAEAAAENPAQVGLRAGLGLLPEEAMPPSIRIDADGSVVEYVGPTSGGRGARGATEEGLYRQEVEAWEAGGKKGPKPERKRRLTAVQRRIRWDPNDEVNAVIEQANGARAAAIDSLVAASIDPARARQRELAERLLPPEGEADLLERWAQARELRDADPNVVAVQQGEAELTRLGTELDAARRELQTTPRTTAVSRRQQAVADAQERIDRATRSKVWKVTDGKVAHTDTKTQKALDLYATLTKRLKARKGRRIAADEQLENDIAKALGYTPTAQRARAGGITRAPAPRTQEMERARYALRTAEDQLDYLTRTGRQNVTDYKERVDALRQRVDELRETVAGHEAQRRAGIEGGEAGARAVDNRAAAIAEAERLFTGRQQIERDLRTVAEGPGQVARLRRDPVRDELTQRIDSLEQRIAQTTDSVAEARRQAKPVIDRFNELDAQIQLQRNTYRELQTTAIPDDTRTVLHEMEQGIRAKQAALAEEDARVARLAEIHRDNIDQAERRVEAAVNLDAELRRRERDAWGTDDASVRAARREVEAHRRGELHLAKQEFEDAQTPITRAKARRDKVKAGLDQAKEHLASGQWTPPEIGARIRQANIAEATQVRDIKARIPRAKTEWRIFPEIDAPPRRSAYTIDQRERLHELYDLINNTHPVDRSGAGGSYLVRQARETFSRITEQGGPKGPKDLAAMDEAAKVLAAHRRGGLNTAAHQRYRAAINEINEIERSVVESATYAQQEFGEVRRIGDMLDRLEDARTPMKMPGKGSKRWKAVAGSPRPPGGPRDVLGRAKENYELAEDWVDNFAQDLVDRGAIDESQVEFIARARDEVRKLIDLHAKRQTPDVKSQLAQASNDLGRLVDVMLSYRNSIAAGYEPSEQLATAIAAHRFLRERNTLDDSIDTIERLLKISPDDRARMFQQELNNHQFIIDIEQKIIDNPDTDAKELQRATNRRNYHRRELGKKLDAGIIQPGQGDLRGVIEDDIDSMTDIILEHLREFDDASNELRTITHWREVYLSPIEKRHSLEVNVGRYEMQLEQLELSRKRLSRAITAARNAGRDRVSWTPSKTQSFTETVAEAERKIEQGAIPDKIIPIVRNEIRIAERRQAAARVKGELGERQITYSVPGLARHAPKEGQKVGRYKRTEMSLAEAEAELARFGEYRESYERAAATNQRQLEAMNGESEKRIGLLSVLISDAEAPLNPAGIKALKDRAREIDAVARTRPGRSLAAKRLPEEQQELDLIAARIEQSTSPPDPQRVAAMQAELAQRKQDYQTYQQQMVYDYELMSNVEDNGYRLLRELTQNLRAPTKAEARMLRQVLGAQQGAHVSEVLATLDDFIVGHQISEERWGAAIEYMQRYAETRRSGDDALERILPVDLPPEMRGRALSFGEVAEATQASTEINTVLGGAGRSVQREISAEGFREEFFTTLIEQARRRRQEAEREIKHFVGWLDMNVHEDVFSTIGIVNKYFGGKIRPYTKKERYARQRARLPTPTVTQRRREAVRASIIEAMMKGGYDPALSLERKLREAKTLRTRLNHYLRGLGLLLVDQSDDTAEVMRWWDEAALGRMGTVESLKDLTTTLRPADEITALAKARVTQLKREITAANKAGDTETAAALGEELNTISAGRLLPTDEQRAAAAAAPQRRPAEPSEIAANQLDSAPDPAELTRMRGELAATDGRYNDLNHQIEVENTELRALTANIAEAEAPTVAEGVTVETVLRELEGYAASVRKKVPEGKFSHADLELAMARNAAFADSLPEEIDDAMEAQLLQMTEDMMRIRENLWTGEPKSVRNQARTIAEQMPTEAAAARTAVAPDVQAGMITRATELRRSIKAAESELEELSALRTSMQQKIDDLDRAHAVRDTSDAAEETPSMVTDPIGASQAEGLPSEGMSPETAPTHLVEDAIFDSDASPEDLLREYDGVVANARALLQQYGSYTDMPPDVRRHAGELANRAQALANRREEAFVAATSGFDEADQTRFVAAAQSMAQSANPRIDYNWWTTISTGTPPVAVSTNIMRGTGVSRRGVVSNQMRTAFKRGELRGRGGTRVRGSLAARERVLRGEHKPSTRVKVRNPRTGRRILQPVNQRQLTRPELRARQYPAFSAAERDLRGIAERARAEAEPLTERITVAEASIAEREAAFLQAATETQQRRMGQLNEAVVAQQTRLNHANDEATQAERTVRRIQGQRERINDAYTRALEAENIQLGEVRRRAVEVQLDHAAAAHQLYLYRAATAPPKGTSLQQLWDDIGDLLEYKRSVSAREPIALGPAGSTPAASPIEVSSLQPEVRQIEALLAAARDQQRQIDELDLHGKVIAKRLRDFEKAPKKNAFFTQDQLLGMDAGQQQAISSAFRGALTDKQAKRFEDVFVRQVADGWQAVAEDMFTGPDALVIANSLQTAMDNIRRTIREPGFWKAIEKYTAFFSTYATAKPGFHVRNAMSGTFMNMVDGVKVRHMRQSVGLWHDFTRNPEQFWDQASPEVRNAFMAVFGSGAGGQFSERGLTEAVTTGGKIYKRLMNNALTKWNRKAGAYVEGPMRLAMALDSIYKGQSLNAALDRITKFHFDYSQLSEMDVIARRMVPFWTFMSRNLPLQIESMWLRPRTYLQYQSLVRNFGEEMDPLTPDYWISQGAFTLDENAQEGKGEPWYLAPDLPHLRVAEPLTALSQGDLGRAVLSDINPLFLAPVEAFAAGKKFYTGGRIGEELREPVGIEGALQPLLQMIGGGATAASGQGMIDPRYAHLANSLLPPVELLNRLINDEGTREGRQGETILRTFGAPVYKLTEGMQRSTIDSRRFERQRERQRQAVLARS